MKISMLKTIVFVLAALAAGTAQARVVLGFHFGIPLYAPYYAPAPYYYPYYYPPPVYYAPPAPQYYPAPAAPAESAPAPVEHFWYYCADARSYYPYVRECPGGWQRVSPTPPQ